MKFKKGQILVRYRACHRWIKYHSGCKGDNVIFVFNSVFENKCFSNSYCVNLCSYNEDKSSEFLCYNSVCEFLIRKATEREEFLYYTHGSKSMEFLNEDDNSGKSKE